MPQPTPAQPQSFGRFRVKRRLGAGAMGEVYEATDELLGRDVAIKTLRGSSGVAARFIDERFRNEARAIAQLAHPGVVRVFDIDLSADPPYLVMECVAGPALSDRIASGPLASDDVVALGVQIARALAAAHAANVIHRDVKPSNILGAGPGVWKLADFGVAHAPDSSLTMTGQFVGSPAYAAPEALVKGISAPAGDVYGLGATLYEAATGSWPRLEAAGALLAPVPPIRERVPHLPPHVADAIDRAVSIDHANRPTAAELADLLSGATTTTSARAMAATPPGGAAALAIARTPAAVTATAGGATAVTPVSIATRAGALPALPVAGATATAGARGPLRWQPWALAGIVALVVVIAIAARGDKKPAAIPGAMQPAGPMQINVMPPSGMDRKMAKDWNKLVEDLQHNDFARARDRLDEWEHKYGETAETQSLRAQLDRLPPELYQRGDERE